MQVFAAMNSFMALLYWVSVRRAVWWNLSFPPPVGPRADWCLCFDNISALMEHCWDADCKVVNTTSRMPGEVTDAGLGN